LTGKEAGWQMSASGIQNQLQRKDPVVFAGILWMTINSWIDHLGSQAKWSDSMLNLTEKGNHQHHPNSGCCGVLVSILALPKLE
jgi:hypothetical protein